MQSGELKAKSWKKLKKTAKKENFTAENENNTSINEVFQTIQTGT